MAHALLIDGENISPAHAGTLLRTVPAECTVRRVYGDAARLNGWLSVAGLHPVHVQPGRNATDVALAVAAMALLAAGTRGFTIATSDGGLLPLATALREAGAGVTMAGEAKTPAALRMAGQRFVELTAPAPKPAIITPAAAITATRVSQPDAGQRVTEFLKETLGNAPDRCLRLAEINPRVHGRLGIKVSSLGAGTWRTFLAGRPDLFALDPKGPDARVRLIST